MSQPRSAHAADVATLAITVMAAIAGLTVFFAGPSHQMPVHWGSDGLVDSWADRQLVGLAIFGLGFLNLVLAGGLGVAAGRAAESARRQALRYTQLLALMVLTLVGLFGASASLSGMTSLTGAAPMAILSVIFLVVGTLLGRVGTNPFVGVRTPWTFRSRLAWERSNRLAGRLLFLLGLIGLATAPFAPQPLGLGLLIGGVLAAVAWSVFESWRVWRSDPDRQPS